MAERLTFSGEQWWDATDRNAYAGAKIYTYEAGTTSPKTTWDSADESTPNANPVVADSNGIFPPIYGDGSYFIEVYNSDDTELVYQEDNVSSVGGTASGNTLEINNLPEAKATDLSDYDSVYIQSLTSGWEDTPSGPNDGFYAHSDGTTGSAGTGDQNQFFDAAGNGWTRDDNQRIDESQFNQNTADIAANAAEIATLQIDSPRAQLLNWSEVFTSNTTLSVQAQGMAFGVDADGNSAFVAVGNDSVDDANAISISRNGIRWTVENNPTSQPLQCCGYGDQLFMATTRTTARVITSPDAETWTEQTALGITVSGVAQGLAFYGGRWVFVTAVNGASNIATSDNDATSWTARTNPSIDGNVGLGAVLHDGTQFVALSFSTVTSAFSLTSPDGATWTEHQFGVNPSGPLTGFAFGNGLYVCVANTTAGNDLEVYVSSDAQTWTQHVVTNNNLLKANPIELIFNNGYFIIITTTGELAISSDGVSWEGMGGVGELGLTINTATSGLGRVVVAGTEFFAGHSTGG